MHVMTFVEPVTTRSGRQATLVSEPFKLTVIE
jgi:hypothetical protein